MNNIDPENPRLNLTAASNPDDDLRAVARGLFGPIREQKEAEAAKLARLCHRAALAHEHDQRVFGKEN